MNMVKCSECGKEIPKESVFCPECGKRINFENVVDGNEITVSNSKTNKTFKIIIGGFLFLVAIALIYYFKVYEGKFNVTQVQGTFELGRQQDLLKTLKYTDKEIIDVSVADDGGFNTDKAGDYNVIFDVTNNRKNHKDIIFTYHVVDTVAPVITVSETELFLAKGSSIDLDSLVAVEDKSGNCTLDFSGELDFEKEGTYVVDVFASDTSGNVSETQTITITVENRDNCDIRMANFGESKEVVKRYETGTLTFEDEECLAYEVTLNGVDAELCYYFNNQDNLYTVLYIMNNTLHNHNAYIVKYDELVNLLEAKYGEPDKSVEYIDSMGGLDKGTLLWLGYYAREDVWQFDTMRIKTMLLSEESNDITFLCGYSSNEFQDDEIEKEEYR